MPRQALSRGDLLLLAIVFSVAGALVAAYLTYEWYVAFGSSFCDINSYFSCRTVGGSVFGSFAGVPTATVGLGGFLILFVLAVLALRGRNRVGPWSIDAWILGFAGLGAAIGLGLTFIEIFVIEAVCILCATGFALDLGVLAVALSLRRRA